MKKIQNLIVFSFFALFVGGLAGCGRNTLDEQQALLSYNNMLIGLQEQAIEKMDTYFSRLEKDYDGENLPELYVQMRNELLQLQEESRNVSGRKEDEGLKMAVTDYISGLVLGLERYEKPVVDLLSEFSGTTQEFYTQQRTHIQEYTLALSKVLAELDLQLEAQQVAFSQRRKYSLSH